MGMGQRVDRCSMCIGDPSTSLPTSANWTMREREVEMPVVSVSKAKTRSPARGSRPCHASGGPSFNLSAHRRVLALRRDEASCAGGNGPRPPRLEEEEDPLAGLSHTDAEHRCGTADAVEAAGALLDGPTVGMKAEEAEATPTPEYDVGEVEADALLDDGPLEPSIDHSELNVVVHEDLADLADPLAAAPVMGDVPEEIEFENDDA